MPTGVASTGHVAGQRLEHGEPEALVLGRHDDGVGGVDPERAPRRDRPRRASAAALRRRGELARAVVALGRRAPGRPGRAGSGPPGRGPAARAPRARRSDGSGRGRHAAGKHGDAPAPPGAGDARGELGADGGHEVQRGSTARGDAPRARVAQVGAVQRHDAHGGRRGERRPRGEPEVRVDDVEAARRRSGGAGRARRAA